MDKVNAESTQNAGRLPFGLPGVNKNQEVSNANYLWISYFYSYLKETGRAGFVMAASATDSASKDRLIRQQLVEIRAAPCDDVGGQQLLLHEVPALYPVVF